MTMYQDLICGSEDEARTNLARLFPKAAKGGDLSGFPPNREAALARLDAMDTFRYAATRNALDGAVTRLSPYLRHGLLTLAETRDHVLARAAAAGRAPSAVAKLVQELAWRDYWRRVYGELGDGVWEDREPYKTGFAATDYADALPADIPQGETGVDFVDHSARVLRDTGYLHNQLRMKIAAYVLCGALAARALAGGGALVPRASSGRRPGLEQFVLAMGGVDFQPQTLHFQRFKSAQGQRRTFRGARSPHGREPL